MSDKKQSPAQANIISQGQRSSQAPADTTETLPDGRTIQSSSQTQPADLPGEQYVPESDVTEETSDGRTIQIASKGVPMPIAQARALGILKDDRKAAPKETK